MKLVSSVFLMIFSTTAHSAPIQVLELNGNVTVKRDWYTDSVTATTFEIRHGGTISMECGNSHRLIKLRGKWSGYIVLADGKQCFDVISSLVRAVKNENKLGLRKNAAQNNLEAFHILSEEPCPKHNVLVGDTCKLDVAAALSEITQDANVGIYDELRLMDKLEDLFVNLDTTEQQKTQIRKLRNQLSERHNVKALEGARPIETEAQGIRN